MANKTTRRTFVKSTPPWALVVGLPAVFPPRNPGQLWRKSGLAV